MTSEIRTNSLKSRAGLSTVTMTDSGPIISGVVTATSFSGDGSNLTGISGTSDNIIEGDTKLEVVDAGSQYITGEVNGSEKIRIASDGQVKLTGNNTANHMLGFGSNVGGLTIDDVGNQHTALEVQHGSNKFYQVCSSNTNNYISSYGAGRLAFEHTGTHGGTREKLTIAANGYIGVNKSSPSYPLVLNYTNNTTYSSSNFIANGLQIENDSTTDNTASGIFFTAKGSGANAGAAHINCIRTANGSGSLAFSTRHNVGSHVERVRITSAGLVGIGQATPTHMLHVDSSNASDSTATAFFKGRIIRFDGAASAHSPRLNFSLDGTDKAQILCHRTAVGIDIATLVAEPIKFKINSAEKLRLDSNGDLGLGIAAVPQDSGARTLHVHSTTTGGGARAALRLTHGGTGSAASNGGFLGIDNNPDLYLYNQENGNLRFGSNQTERLRITSGGDILTAQNGTAFSWPSNPGHVIYPNGEYRSTSTNGTHIRCNRMNGDGHVAQWYRGQTNMVGYISITSSGTGYGSGSSDERTKKNIEAWDENILDKFKSLTPKKFNFNWEDDSVSKHKGYIAQNEFEKFPEAYPKNNLTDCDNEYHMFVPTDMTVYLMKGLKEAAEKIEQLEQENIALRIRVTNLEDN